MSNVVEKDTEITEVVFRKFPEKDGGDVIAVFPKEEWSRGNLASYMHMGQHGPCSVFIADSTKPATEGDYADLKAELESIGYNLKVSKKINRNR